MLTTHGDAITKIYMGQTTWFLHKIKFKRGNKRKWERDMEGEPID